jgi:hypothetical protein
MRTTDLEISARDKLLAVMCHYAWLEASGGAIGTTQWVFVNSIANKFRAAKAQTTSVASMKAWLALIEEVEDYIAMYVLPNLPRDL